MSEALTHSPADILSRVLIELTLGTDPDAGLAWPVYVGDGPPPLEGVPDEIIAIGDTTGTNDGRDMVTGERYEHYGVQVKVRSRRDDKGWEKVESICHALNEQIRRRDVIVDAQAYRIQCIAGVNKLHDRKREPKSDLHNFFINGRMSVWKTSV